MTSITKPTIIWRFLPLAALAVLGRAGEARAHPHVWVTVRTAVLFEDGAITGIQHAWTFDDMYTATAIEGLDANKDGKYERNELKALAQVNMDGLKEFNYFTTAARGKDAIELGAPTDYWLDYTNTLLTLHFTLPLTQPLTATGKALTFAAEDPSFFIAFDLAKDDPVKLSGAVPAGCHAMRNTPAVTTDQQNLSDAFSGQPDPAGDEGGNTVDIQCPP